MYLLGVQWNMDFIQRWFYVSKIAKECLAGFTVAIVALPLAIAFGIAATGTSEERLLDCMVRFLQVYSRLFGGTPGQVTGYAGPLPLLQQELLRRTG